MNKAVLVFRKELTDSLRERRALATALLFGPLFGPVLFGIIVSFTIDRQVDEPSEPLEVPMVGGAQADNLMGYLRHHLIDTDGDRFDEPDALRAAVRSGEIPLGLVVDEGFAAALRDGAPARLWIVTDQSNLNAQAPRQRLRSAINQYAATIGMQRLQLRGIDPRLARPFAVLLDDLSTPSGRSAMLFGMMTYFLLFAMLIGGLQVAIDATAGERERGSLEPLLTLPVSRGALVVGKVVTAAGFMAVSLALAVAAFAAAVQFMPLARVGLTTNLTPMVCLGIYAAMLPFTVLGAGLLTVVASFTKTFREAQTYTSIAMMIPPLPVLLAFLNPLQASVPLMLVPGLSQHLLVTALMKGDHVDPTHVALSAVSTIAAGALCTWAAGWRFRSEKLLV